MPEVELKSLSSQRVAQISGYAPAFGNDSIGPVIGPMFTALAQRLSDAGVDFGPMTLAVYEAQSDSRVKIDAAFEVGPDVWAGEGFDVIELPDVDVAATTIHRGSMATIGDTWEALMEWIVEHGHEPSGVCRELYVVSEPEPQDEWVTELQQPVRRGAA